MNFANWLENKNESYNYNPSIDGPPLEPHTISGAEVQIRQLATNIRTTFGLDPKWKDYQQQFQQATALLEKAASLLDDGTMSGDLRNAKQRP